MADDIQEKLAVIEEKLDFADRERAELKAWLGMAIHDMRATMELMRQQHQEQIELLKKTAKTTTGRLQSGSPNWKELLPPSWQR